MKNVLILICLSVLAIGSSQAQVTTLKSGAWEDPGLWSSGQIPDSLTDVLIAGGDTVLMPEMLVGPESVCRNLTISAGGVMLVRDRNMRVLEETLVEGVYADTSNSGINTFEGFVRLENNGYWNTTSITNPGRVRFEGGIIHNGDSLLLNRGGFYANDQTIKGNQAVVFSKNFTIESGLTITNQNQAGVFITGGTLQGDSTSVFKNESILDIQTNVNIAGNLQLDLSHEGNIVRYNRFGVQNVYPLTYYHLELLGDENANNLKRNLNGMTEVLGDLLVGSKAQLALNGHHMLVRGKSVVSGSVFESIGTGLFETQELVLQEGWLDGSPAEFGDVLVHKDLVIKAPGGQVSEAHMTVEGKLLIEEGAEYRIISDLGTHQYQALEMERRALFSDNSLGTSFTFAGDSWIDGSFFGNKSLYRFEGLLTIADSGNFVCQQITNQYQFLGGYWNNGFTEFNKASFLIQGTFGGNNKISFPGDVLIKAGETLEVVDSVEFVADIEGEDENSLLLNSGTIIFNANSNDIIPLERGKVDFCSRDDNLVVYASNLNNQRIRSGCYQDIAFINSNKLLTDGNLEIYGDVWNEVDLREDNNLFTPGLIRFLGDSIQTINGNGTFRSIEIDKQQNHVQSEDTFLISKALIMTNGLLVTSEGGVGLSGGATLAENSASYVLGVIGTERNLPGGARNAFGGLGLTIKADSDKPLGSTVVIRHTGKAVAPGHIERYYEISPVNNQNLNAEVEFFYFDRELYGADELELDLYMSIDGGPFENLEGRNLPVSNIVRRTRVNEFGILSLKPVSMAVIAYPSPFSEQDVVTVAYILDEDGPVDITIFDRAGRTVYKETIENGRIGLNRFTLDRPFRQGLYYVRVVSENNSGYNKLLSQ